MDRDSPLVDLITLTFSLSENMCERYTSTTYTILRQTRGKRLFRLTRSYLLGQSQGLAGWLHGVRRIPCFVLNSKSLNLTHRTPSVPYPQTVSTLLPSFHSDRARADDDCCGETGKISWGIHTMALERVLLELLGE